MLTLTKTSKISVMFFMICAFLCSANTFAQRVIEMEGTNQMRFSVEQITAKPGEKITVKLKTVSSFPAAAMSHNFVLLKKGVDAKAFIMAGISHKDNEYIDPAKQSDVLAQTKLASGGQTVEVTFTAPTEPGNYEYICTFPGHFVSGMKGVLTVK